MDWGKRRRLLRMPIVTANKYQSVLWANAETEGELVTSFTHMAKLLALPGIDLQQRESVLDGMRKWFTSTTDWLLIVDNADDLTVTRRFLPTFASGHVLLTSRVAAIGEEAQSLELLPFSPDDGALCLLRRANYIPWTGQLHDAPSPASVKAAQELSERHGWAPAGIGASRCIHRDNGKRRRGLPGTLQKISSRDPAAVIMETCAAIVRRWLLPGRLLARVSSWQILLRLNCCTCALSGSQCHSLPLFPNDARILGPTLGPVAAHPPRLDLNL